MPEADISRVPTYQDVAEAHGRIQPYVIETPLLRSDGIDRIVGAHVWFKAEPLQRTGSFKIRGALNRLLQLTPDERKRGVIAWSSGNHAQGVAAAAAQVGTPAVIVMPSDAPAIKMENTRNLGADVVTYDRAHEDREALARKIAAERGLIIVPSYDDPDIIAGQGTLGLELSRQVQTASIRLDDMLVPVSGGGLIAGVSLAIKHDTPKTRMIGVEPAGFDDHAQSLKHDKIVKNTSPGPALCDALLAQSPGHLTWSINREHVTSFSAVDDNAIKAAMALMFRELKLVVEPGGAVGLAALLQSPEPFRGRTVGVVLSGGNIDPAVFSACLATGVLSLSHLS